MSKSVKTVDDGRGDSNSKWQKIVFHNIQKHYNETGYSVFKLGDFKDKFLEEMNKDFPGSNPESAYASIRKSLQELVKVKKIKRQSDGVYEYIDKGLTYEAIDLLKYKNQIILQGPPGTGKTRLAKLIADNLTETENRGSPTQLINNLINNFDVESEEARLERENLQLMLSVFNDEFPKEKLKELTLESYSIGTGLTPAVNPVYINLGDFDYAA